MNYRAYKFGWFKTSNVELFDLFKSWIAISFAFGIAFSGLKFDTTFIYSLILAFVVVGTAFIFHELGHKIVAQKYKYPAEFRAFDKMLWLAIGLSFLGFVIAAPGAVMIQAKRISKKINGYISLAGPLVNVVLALFFFIVFRLIFVDAGSFIINSWSVADILIKVNGFIALFNLIPAWLFDGAKIWRWNKLVWIVMVIVSAACAFVI
jgi:Zn-dependent protease